MVTFAGEIAENLFIMIALVNLAVLTYAPQLLNRKINVVNLALCSCTPGLKRKTGLR